MQPVTDDGPLVVSYAKWVGKKFYRMDTITIYRLWTSEPSGVKLWLDADSRLTLSNQTISLNSG